MAKRRIHAFHKNINAKWNVKQPRPGFWTLITDSIFNEKNRYANYSTFSNPWLLDPDIT